MGRRYGRNQKRRHRARIAELEAEVASLKRAMERRTQERDRAAREVQRIVEEVRKVSPWSGLLEPRSVNGDTRDPYILEHEVLHWGRYEDTVRVPCRTTVNRVIAQVVQDPQRFGCHVRLHAREWGWQYYVDLEAIKHARDLSHVMDSVVDALKHALVQGLYGRD